MNLKLFKRLNTYYSIREYFQSIAIAWIAFFIALGFTYFLWSNAQNNAINEAQTHFHNSNILSTEAIINRMQTYENTLKSSSALLNTVERMNRHKWYIYISSLELEEHYPGFQGIGFSKVISNTKLSDHIKQMHIEGIKNYTIKPSGNRPEYHSIIYLEPLNQRNFKAIGYDMFTNPIRQSAMIRARDTGKTSISGKVILIQEVSKDIQPGFLMYVPFYHTEKILHSPEQRREHLEGFTYAPFRAYDLMNEIFRKKNPNITIKIYDGDSIAPKNLLFQNNHTNNPNPLFTETIPLKMYGQTWTAVFETLPSYKSTIDYRHAHLIILAGLPISFLLLITILSFSKTAQQAQTLARKMTVEIRNLNTELENMINSAPNPIIVHSEDGTIVKINQAWSDICGYTQEETPTTDIWVDKVYQENQAKIKTYIRSLSNITQKVDEGEFSFYSKSGKKITWQFSSAPFGVLNGKKTIISSAMDITELKSKENMLMMQSRYAAMGEMINMIAHQWRQPLTSISTIAGTLNLEAMLDQYDQNHFMEKLNSISDLAIDLSKTINDFRNFFKEDKIKEVTTWKQLIEGSLKIIEPMLAAKNITLDISYDENVSLNIYTRELQQVILNILKNSEDVLIDNTIEKPKIWIRTSQKEGRSCLEIEDNGGGIPTEIISKVFDPYFSTKGDKDGTGIGLYLSKIIVEQHCKGMLNVHNTNNGACFQITI